MKKFIGGAGAHAALAAILAAAVTAAVMMAVRPADAQEPRIVLRSNASAASIGVGIREVMGEDATKAKMAQPSGVYVESVREGSPAARAGIQAGDIVIDFDGERVRSTSHFTRLVQESVPNRQITAVVVRGTSKQTVNVVPEASGGFNLLSGDARRQLQEFSRQAPRNFNFELNPETLRRALPVTGSTLGVTVSPLTEQLASHFGVKQGVLVTAVISDSPAAGAGVRAGDVITVVNGQTVSSSADISRALRENREETVDLTVTRDKKSLPLKATIPAKGRNPSGRGGLPA